MMFFSALVQQYLHFPHSAMPVYAIIENVLPNKYHKFRKINTYTYVMLLGWQTQT